MGIVFDEFGALSGAVEASYGTDPTPTEGLYIQGQPNYQHDDAFEQQEYLELENSSRPGTREHRKLDLSFQNMLGYMEDIDGGNAANHAVLLACGFDVHDRAAGGTTGSGNFVEYRPVSSGYKSSAFYGYLKEDGAGELSILKHLGSRGNFNLNIEGGNPILLDTQIQALHDFWIPFDVAANNAPPTRLGYGVDIHESNCITATIDGNEIDIVRFSYNPGYEPSVPESDITACDAGISEILLNNGTHQGQLAIKFRDTLIDGLGTEDWVKQAHDADVDYAFVLTRDDGTQLFRITMPKMRWQGMQIESGDAERKIFVIDYIAQADAGDDNATLRFEVK